MSLSGEKAKISEMQFCQSAPGNARRSFRNPMKNLLRQQKASQRSLHNAPIFRLLLKVAVNGTHQCDFLNF